MLSNTFIIGLNLWLQCNGLECFAFQRKGKSLMLYSPIDNRVIMSSPAYSRVITYVERSYNLPIGTGYAFAKSYEYQV